MKRRVKQQIESLELKDKFIKKPSPNISHAGKTVIAMTTTGQKRASDWLRTPVRQFKNTILIPPFNPQEKNIRIRIFLTYK